MGGFDKTAGLGTWMKEFSPTSEVRGEWELGSILFFTDGNGTEGMKQKVAEFRPNEFTRFEMVAELIGGNEKPYEGEEYESYTLTEENGVTTLSIESFSPEESMLEMFEGLWDKGLEKIKELAEG